MIQRVAVKSPCTALIWIWVGLMAAACGSSKELPKLHVESRAAVVEAAAPAPATEEAVIDAVVVAFVEKNMASLKKVLSPELGADLERIHRSDPARFWKKSKRLVANVRSGMRITHRDDQTKGTWRVLVKFGNGQEERMIFTRVEGRLLIQEM